MWFIKVVIKKILLQFPIILMLFVINSSTAQEYCFVEKYPELIIDSSVYKPLEVISHSILNCNDFLKDSFFIDISISKKEDFLLFNLDVSEGSLPRVNNDTIYGSIKIGGVNYVFYSYDQDTNVINNGINTFLKQTSNYKYIKYHYQVDEPIGSMYHRWPLGCEKCKVAINVFSTNNIKKSIRRKKAIIYTKLCLSVSDINE